MESFGIVPTHFIRQTSRTLPECEMRELYPLKNYQTKFDEISNSKTEEVKNEVEIRTETNGIETEEAINAAEESLVGLIWNETEKSATYVNQNAWHIPIALTLHYASLVHRLDLSYNCLQTLTGIEYFTCLEELILDNNLLDDSIRFAYNPYMRILAINKNKITDLERFLNEITLKLPNLTYLSMLGNSACPDQLSSSDHDEKDYRRYRSYVVHRIPNLKFLDSGPVRAQERVDAQKRGHYYRLIRLNSDSVIESNHLGLEEEMLNRQQQQRHSTPLPCNSSDTPKGAFGRLRHRYTGKHSEGNRFIRNHEL